MTLSYLTDCLFCFGVYVLADNTWIKLWRKSIDSAVFSNADLWKLWSLCLMKASYSERWVSFENSTNPIHIFPGQFITGRFSLHEEFYGSKRVSKKNKSALTVWRMLQKLEKLGNVNIKTYNKYSIISIVNWNEYQQDEQQMNNRRTTDEQQVNTNKKVKKDNKEKKDKYFDLFWLNYPRKVGKGAALKAWKKISDKHEVLEQIKNILPQQKTSDQWTKDNGQYIPNPATYLNQRRWEDEI